VFRYVRGRLMSRPYKLGESKGWERGSIPARGNQSRNRCRCGHARPEGWWLLQPAVAYCTAVIAGVVEAFMW
ncbi:MAG TPA: hypothetical protein PLY40_01600, partial [Bacillota bacterium]|nr:hypothetical protein [Bacillota bacterium]